MATAGCQPRETEPYLPRIYREDSQIPFAPDGNSPMITGSVERVRGISDEFKNLICVRKSLKVSDDLADNRQRLVQEAKILHSAYHHHVVRLIHTYFYEADDDETIFAVVMDRADGSLDKYLKPGKTPLAQWFGCLMGVVRHIHALGIRHRDIKPANILVKGGEVLLADFGISQMGLGRTMPTTFKDRSPSRSREYCAPEIDRGSTRGRSADIFSLGAVFLEMFLALYHQNEMKSLKNVLRPSPRSTLSYAQHINEVHEWVQQSLHPDGWQRDLLNTCLKMLRPARDDRPSAEDVISIFSPMSSSDATMVCNCVRNRPSPHERLTEACRMGRAEEVHDLLENGVDPNTLGAIHFAATRGSVAMLEDFLAAGALVDTRNTVDQTALQCAARNGFEDAVRLLLRYGADVNASDENDQTVLHGAAAHGHLDIVRILLNGNADRSKKDLEGQTAIALAARRNHDCVVQYLLHYAH
ncbi:hypothetical protein LTR78_010584 [Recurvomyces mirabilis]|uniref:Protein kinase domain-containing protein n=1 Tax=Recurvomyces mirabilis TaxID=574656 RepID=A0AAE0TMM4_9PEZI|nr:hypothetical protein LTR78_010584 [Recurvomyces mirabilis]KAK5150128.1 hypothetical protein LTS14_010391 [Recurvomyces mirabilis]